jgi:hypothetical protein
MGRGIMTIRKWAKILPYWILERTICKYTPDLLKIDWKVGYNHDISDYDYRSEYYSAYKFEKGVYLIVSHTSELEKQIAKKESELKQLKFELGVE